MHMISTDNKSALVTAGARGLGAALLDLLRSAGWNAVGLDLVRPDDDPEFVVADVSDAAAVESAVAHCAGIFRNSLSPHGVRCNAVMPGYMSTQWPPRWWRAHTSGRHSSARSRSAGSPTPPRWQP